MLGQRPLESSLGQSWQPELLKQGVMQERAEHRDQQPWGPLSSVQTSSAGGGKGHHHHLAVSAQGEA